MITELTPQQVKDVEAWRQRWFDIGCCCEPADRPMAEKTISELYLAANHKPPKHFIWCGSPLTANLTINFLDSLRDSLGDSLRASLRDSLRDSLGDSLRDSLRDSLGDSLVDSLRDSLWASLRASLRDSLWDSLGDSLRDSLRDSLGDSLWASLGDSLWASLRDSLWASLCKYNSCWFWGQMDSYWICFYLFCEYIGISYDAKSTKKLHLLANLAQTCSWWWPFENAVIISERPTAINWNGNNPPRIHADGKPAVEFRDGWKVWALNGMRVSQKVAETPATELDPNLILTEQNIDVRREIVRKIGIERALSELGGSVLDSTSTMSGDGRFYHYELVTLDLQDGRRRPYLKFKNASLDDVWHIEGVPPNCHVCPTHRREHCSLRDGDGCNTVAKALYFRNGTEEMPAWLH